MTATLASPHRYYLDGKMDQPDLISVDGGNVVAFSRVCPDKEDPNDDSAAIIHTACGAIVLAVADGVGGAPLGYKASAIAMECLSESLAVPKLTTDLRPAILDGIEKANAEILDMGTGAATTISIVEIRNRIARALSGWRFNGDDRRPTRRDPLEINVAFTRRICNRIRHDRRSRRHASRRKAHRVQPSWFTQHAHRNRPRHRIVSSRYHRHRQRRPVRQPSPQRSVIARPSRTQPHGPNELAWLTWRLGEWNQADEGIPGKPDDLAILLMTP